MDKETQIKRQSEIRKQTEKKSHRKQREIKRQSEIKIQTQLKGQRKVTRVKRHDKETEEKKHD